MDATCKICGNPAEIATTGGGRVPCASCARREGRRRLIFDVGEKTASARATEAQHDDERRAPPSPPEETRMLDLQSLAKRTRDSLASLPYQEPTETLEVPLSVREAILLVDSIAPASIEPAPIDVVPYPLGEPTSPSPARRRLRAVYSGAGLLVVMAGLVVAKARMGQEVASAAAIVPGGGESTALLMTAPESPAATASPTVATPAPTATVAPAPTVAPAATPHHAPTSQPKARPRAPVVDAPDTRASTDPTATPRVDLLGAMAAAVAAHSAPPSAPRVDSTPAPPALPETRTPSAPAGTRTSPLHP